MDLLRLGLRSVLGITLPGAMLVLIGGYFLFSALFSLDLPMANLLWGKDQQLIVFSILFLVSYNLGGMLRLNSADKVDEKSSRWLRNELRKAKAKNASKPDVDSWENEEKILESVQQSILSQSEMPDKIPPLFDEWIWRVEKFPYPVWQFRKFERYHPEEVKEFYTGYRECMGFSERHGVGVGRGKEFFNYCKLVILNSGRSIGDSLVEEVHYAEATVRFYAGTYTGLILSLCLLLILLVGQAAVLFGFVGFLRISLLKGINAALTLGLILVFLIMKDLIVKRFRTLRLKEVDTVYDAFYLVHRHADHCTTCSPPKTKGSALYRERENLLRAAFQEAERGPVVLDRLLALMKEQSLKVEHLSSLYFAGAEGDHPFFLKSDRVALGLSVLPEDAAKAGLRKRHPHQDELIFVLAGALRLRVEEEGATVEKELGKGEVAWIKKGQCHCIEPIRGGDSAFLFVKTDPGHEPRSESCDLEDAALILPERPDL
jgi:mannose-6-phosphate isomerase-like protein (cupin superfamily)